MEANADGSFDIVLSAQEQAGKLARARAGNQRRNHPRLSRGPSRGQARCLDHPNRTTRHPPRASPMKTWRDASERRRLGSGNNPRSRPVPPIGDPNTMQEPLPMGAITYGWGASDASYGMGNYALEDDEALIIEGTSPKCAFWNLCIWNEFLHTYNYDYERVSINGHQIAVQRRRVVDARDLGTGPWPPQLDPHAGPQERRAVGTLVPPRGDSRPSQQLASSRSPTLGRKRRHDDRARFSFTDPTDTPAT